MAEGERKSVYYCRLHLTDLLPLYCRNCDCPICCVCVVTYHKGHDICNVSECVDKKADELNDAIQQKHSACFDMKLLEENLKKRQESFQSQTEHLIRNVQDREGEIVAEVRNVCRQTIDRLRNLTTEAESQIQEDEGVLHRFSKVEFFRNISDDDCIECVYFDNELKRLVREQKQNMEGLMPFKFVAPTLSSEHLSELFGSVLTEDHLSSDATTGENDSENHKHTAVYNVEDTECSSSVSEEKFLECQIYDYKKSLIKTGIQCVIPISSDRGILYSYGSLYHYNCNNINRFTRRIVHFTYVPETDEVIFIQRDKVISPTKVLRGRLRAFKQQSVLITLNCDGVLCIGHDDENYIIIVFSLSETIVVSRCKSYIVTNCYICKVNDMGCVLTQRKLFRYAKTSRFKLHASSLVQIQEHQISVYKGYSDDILFSYSGCVGKEPSSTFSPADLCTDPDKNFLIVDSYDNTVHLLDPAGKPLRVIMLAEDGLCGIYCVAMDEFNWLWLGCEDGALHFANYQYFKNTTRKERRLMEQI